MRLIATLLICSGRILRFDTRVIRLVPSSQAMSLNRRASAVFPAAVFPAAVFPAVVFPASVIRHCWRLLSRHLFSGRPVDRRRIESRLRISGNVSFFLMVP